MTTTDESIRTNDIHDNPRTMDARTTLQQITNGGLMTVGASNIGYANFGGGTDAVTMDARIHPIIKSGRRGQAARVMQIKITLGHDDLYRVSVRYMDRRTFSVVTHWESDGIYADRLAHVFVALDSGTETR